MKIPYLKLKATTIIFVANFLLPNFTFAQAGSLDLTFGTSGIVTTAVGSSGDDGKSVQLQPDGKIVVAGYSFNGITTDFALLRYNSDGSLDNTFGDAGKVTTDFGGSDEYGWSAAIQPDGKIVVSGSGIGDFAIARYNSDGTLDNTFGSGGKVTTDIEGLNDYGLSVAIQSDYKIVVAGTAYIASVPYFALVRYNSDGTLDNLFGTEGIVTTAIGSSDYGNSVAIQSDGKIVVSGYSYDGSGNDFALVRYNNDGNLDNTFGTGGKVITDFGSSADDGYSIAIQGDNKIVVAGYNYNGSDWFFALARYNNDGTLDNTFGLGGTITTMSGGYPDDGNSVAIQSDGKILVAGLNGYDPDTDFGIVRYNSDGSLDNTFGIGGKVTTAIGTGNDGGNSIAIQPDGKIVVAGYTDIGSDYDIAIARYNVDSVVVGLNETTTYNSILVFPNPFSNEISIKQQVSCSNTGEIILFDILGNEILHQLFYPPESIIHTQNIPSGFYSLQYSDGINSENFKLVKF